MLFRERFSHSQRTYLQVEVEVLQQRTSERRHEGLKSFGCRVMEFLHVFLWSLPMSCAAAIGAVPFFFVRIKRTDVPIDDKIHDVVQEMSDLEESTGSRCDQSTPSEARLLSIPHGICEAIAAGIMTGAAIGLLKEGPAVQALLIFVLTKCKEEIHLTPHGLFSSAFWQASC